MGARAPCVERRLSRTRQRHPRSSGGNRPGRALSESSRKQLAPDIRVVVTADICQACRASKGDRWAPLAVPVGRVGVTYFVGAKTARHFVKLAASPMARLF